MLTIRRNSGFPTSRTCTETGVALSGDEIIGDHDVKNDMGFVPITVSPHLRLFERILYGWDPLPSPEFETNIQGPAVDCAAHALLK